MENNGAEDTFVPFTKAERIQQLTAIDKKIVSLLTSTGKAVQCLGTREPEDEDVAMSDKDRADQFKEHMDEFLTTLRTVNVEVKRQIWGLEEAGIISLSKKGPAIREEGGEVQASSARNEPLGPDGNGKIGGLDVGWLNSRSDKVEKGMEEDLWQEAEDTLRQLLAAHDQDSANSTVP
ncbi:mediator complex, subunit Med11 [Xylariaceae sp. FL0255]|nr:mediator complex, subunit Med11 [Xylariaceae sp. FL0255]